MNFKRSIAILLGLFAVNYALGLMNWPHVFIVSFFLSACIAAFLVIANIVWLIISPKTKSLYRAKKSKFKVIIFACFMLFLSCNWLIEHFYRMDKDLWVKSLAYGCVLLFVLFSGWCLLKSKFKIFASAAVLFCIAFGGGGFIFFHGGEQSLVSDSDRLRSLPYSAWSRISTKGSSAESGVVSYQAPLSFEGLNLYNSGESLTAHLIDMSGNVLHVWSPEVLHEDWLRFQHFEIYNDSDSLGIVRDSAIMMIDYDSNVKWVNEMRVHHDIAVADNNDIYVLSRKNEIIFFLGLPAPVINDYVLILSPEGKIKGEISLYHTLKESVRFSEWLGMLADIYIDMISPKVVFDSIRSKIKGEIFLSGVPKDIFHTNTVEIISRDMEGLCVKGDLLICVRNLDFIAIIGQHHQRVLWGWGSGELSRPHLPTLLDNGNILVFDNGVDKEISRIVEINPFTKGVEWEYTARAPDHFFSSWGGCSQRLPNGNTLITETNRGYVFEVTEVGEVVWEFYNPAMNLDKDLRAVMYRMIRIFGPKTTAFLTKPHDK